MTKSDLKYEESYHNIALLVSIVLHVVLILFILFWPSMRYSFPPPGKEGVLVVFGDVPESEQAPQNNEKSIDKPQKPNKTEKKQKIKEETKKNVEKQITEDESPVKVKENNKKTEPKSKPVKKTEPPTKDITEVKDEFSKLFNSRGTKKHGKGLQGDPLGDRDAEVLEGITRGKGKVGSGLDSRGILYEPSFDDSSQKSGRVVVKICINQAGNVISARYTQRGSTTTDSELIDLAVYNAKKYRFTPSNKEKQCGTIIIDFIVK